MWSYIKMSILSNSWGLVAQIGPWSATPRDQKILNSRNGGPHAGHGNWMQTFQPRPYIPTKPYSKPFKYIDGPGVVGVEDYSANISLKGPGINFFHNRGAAGQRRLKDLSRSKYGVDGSRAYNGQDGNGLDNPTITNSPPVSSPPRYLNNNVLDEYVMYGPESSRSNSSSSRRSSSASSSSTIPPRYDPGSPSAQSFNRMGPNEALPGYYPADDDTMIRLMNEYHEGFGFS